MLSHFEDSGRYIFTAEVGHLAAECIEARDFMVKDFHDDVVEQRIAFSDQNRHK